LYDKDVLQIIPKATDNNSNTMPSEHYGNTSVTGEIMQFGQSSRLENTKKISIIDILAAHLFIQFTSMPPANFKKQAF